MKIEKLPLEMSQLDLKEILGDLGFDPQLSVAKITEDENQKVAVVKILETGADFTNKMDGLEINGNPVECSVLREEKDQPGFLVKLQFCGFAEIPSRDEIEEKILQAGLEAPQKWRTSGPDRFSMIIGGEEAQKGKIKAALEDLGFGEKIAVSVKELRSKGFSVRVTRGHLSIRLTNLPLDCDIEDLREAVRRTLISKFEIKNCKEEEAEISYAAREMDLANKLDGMKVGENVVKVVREAMDGNYVVPADWTEDKMKEVLGIENLVPLEIQVKDEKVSLVFKPTKEKLPKIIQELTRLRPQLGESAVEDDVNAEEKEVKSEEEELTEKEIKAEEEEVKSEDEGLKEKEIKVEEEEVKSEEEEIKDKKEVNFEEEEAKDDSDEKIEVPMMIDGKPVVFASADIREKKKAQAQVEEAEQTNANIINVNEAEDE